MKKNIVSIVLVLITIGLLNNSIFANEYSTASENKFLVENNTFRLYDEKAGTDITISYPSIYNKKNKNTQYLNLKIEEFVVSGFLDRFNLDYTIMDIEYEIKTLNNGRISILFYGESIFNFSRPYYLAIAINISINNAPEIFVISEISLSEVIDYEDIKANFNHNNFTVVHGFVEPDEYDDALKNEEYIRGFYITEDNRLGIIIDWYSINIFESKLTIGELKK